MDEKPSAGWYQRPLAPEQDRYWDGEQWTEHVHSAESATNETTSTIAAAQLKSQTGIGRSARPTIPCAAAVAG